MSPNTRTGSISAIGRVVRIDTGTIVACAEGYVGADEPSVVRRRKQGPTVTARLRRCPKRADYAIRAMAQTRAIKPGLPQRFLPTSSS